MWLQRLQPTLGHQSLACAVDLDLFTKRKSQISRMTGEGEGQHVPDAWVSSGGSIVRLLGELVTSFNPEPSSSLRLFLSFTLNVPRSISSWTTSLSTSFDFFSFLSFLARARISNSSAGPDREPISSSTCLSSSSSANPAFLRSGEPRAGLDALGCIGPSGLSDRIDGPTSVFTESNPLGLRLGFRFVDDSRSTRLM